MGAILDPERYEDLLERGYRVDVLSREATGAPRAFSSSSSGVPGYPCYRTVEETEAAMHTIASDHPDLATIVDIGDSWTKVTSGGSDGYDLLVLKLTNSKVPGPKPAFFLMGAIHAREYVTAETALRFAEKMVNGYGTDADATWLLDNYELHVLPQANPDGRKLAEQGYYQRKNLDDSAGGCWGPPTGSSQTGTDLNRNSSYRWGGAGATTAPCDQMYRGKSAARSPRPGRFKATWRRSSRTSAVRRTPTRRRPTPGPVPQPAQLWAVRPLPVGLDRGWIAQRISARDARPQIRLLQRLPGVPAEHVPLRRERQHR